MIWLVVMLVGFFVIGIGIKIGSMVLIGIGFNLSLPISVWLGWHGTGIFRVPWKLHEKMYIYGVIIVGLVFLLSFPVFVLLLGWHMFYSQITYAFLDSVIGWILFSFSFISYGVLCWRENERTIFSSVTKRKEKNLTRSSREKCQ